MVSSKNIAEAHRRIDIAKERGMTIQQILSHDVISASPLFDGDLPSVVNKSKLRLSHTLISPNGAPSLLIALMLW